MKKINLPDLSGVIFTVKDHNFLLLNRIFLLSFLLLISSSCLQAQQFPRAMSYGTTNDDFGLRVRVDTEGNVYSVGSYKGTIDFGNGKTLTANGTPAIGLYIAKHNSEGELLWVFNGGTDDEELFYMDLDDAGNVYVSGSFMGTEHYGSNTFTTKAGESNDNFLMKINNDGSFGWSRHINGPNHEHVQGMVVSGNGDVYISGFFEGTFTYEGTTFTNNGSADIFIMKFDTDNNFIWGNAHGGIGRDQPWDLDLDDNGNLYLAAEFMGNFNWDKEAVTLYDFQDVLVVKMQASDGSVQFVKSFGGDGVDGVRGIKIGPEGTIYVSGFFFSEIDFGTAKISTSGLSDGFILKLDANGNYLWSKSFGGASEDVNIISNAVDQYGNVYVGGSFNQDITADGVTFTNHGSRDIFVGRYLSNGSFDKGFLIGGTGIDQLGGIGINENGKMWFTGRFAGKTLAFGSHSFTNKGNASTDIVLAEVGDFVTGIADPATTGNSIEIFPNPATDRIFFEGMEKNFRKLSVFDYSGKLIGEYELKQPLKSLAIHHLEKGVYFLKFEEDGAITETYRFVKM